MKRFIENYLIFCTAIILPARSCCKLLFQTEIWILIFKFYYSDGLSIDIDTSQAPQLANFATRVKQALTPWYPVISTELSSPDFTPPDNIAIKFDPNYNGVAVTSGNKIVGSVRYYTSSPDDIGSMIHEMTHVIQSYKSCPVWLTEGIADWIRYYKYEPSSRLPTKPKSTDTYRMGYGTAAYFLQYIIDNTPKWGAPYHLVYWANRNCRSGTYTDSMWSSMTGKTLDQLWQDMIKSWSNASYVYVLTKISFWFF